MKTRLMLLIFWFTINTFGLFSQEAAVAKDSTGGIDYNVGLNVSINNVKIKMGEDDITNTLSFSFIALKVDIDLLDFLSVGITAGLSSNQFNEPVDFIQLPISLRFNKEKTTQ